MAEDGDRASTEVLKSTVIVDAQASQPTSEKNNNNRNAKKRSRQQTRGGGNGGRGTEKRAKLSLVRASLFYSRMQALGLGLKLSSLIRVQEVKDGAAGATAQPQLDNNNNSSESATSRERSNMMKTVELANIHNLKNFVVNEAKGE